MTDRTREADGMKNKPVKAERSSSLGAAIRLAEESLWTEFRRHFPTADSEMTREYTKWNSYEADVAYVREVIPQRGCLWEGARPAFEAGTYRDENLARMLAEGVIVPADAPDGGYVLPVDQTETP